MRKLSATLLGLLFASSPAFAQDHKPVDLNVGFGVIFPTSDLKNDFNAGWNGTIGVTFNVNEKLGFLVDYTYDRMNGPSKTISVTSNPIAGAVTNGVIDSNHQMHVVTFDAVYKATSKDSPVGGYILGGGGYYHRIVQLTSPSVGFTSICDPFWYVCYPIAVPVTQIIGDRSSNDFGINFGGGITFGHEAKFYVEARYHYVIGKDITPSTSNLPSTAAAVANCSSGCSTSASYFPIIFGIRW
jgi:opacity protein-like surface antigen